MVWLLVVTGAATATILLILVVALVRHLRGLAAALEGLQGDLVPVLEEIRRGSAEAQATLHRLQDRASAPRDEPG
jgi:hypothetical protein